MQHCPFKLLVSRCIIFVLFRTFTWGSLLWASVERKSFYSVVFGALLLSLWHLNTDGLISHLTIAEKHQLWRSAIIGLHLSFFVLLPKLNQTNLANNISDTDQRLGATIFSISKTFPWYKKPDVTNCHTVDCFHWRLLATCSVSYFRNFLHIVSKR